MSTLARLRVLPLAVALCAGLGLAACSNDKDDDLPRIGDCVGIGCSDVGKSAGTLVALRTAGVENIALRAQGLSPASLSGVADMIEHIRRLEQGGAATPPSPAPEPGE